MTRGSSSRWTLLLAPTMLVVGAAAVFSSLPLRDALAQAQQQERAVAGALPRPEQLAAAEQQLSALRAKLQQRAQAVGSAPAGGAMVVASPERAAWHRQLTDVLQRNRLVVLAEERLDVDLPAAVARSLFGPAGSTHHAAWSLQLAGGYLDVLAAVTALRQVPLPTFVLELAMQRTGDGHLVWTLVVT